MSFERVPDGLGEEDHRILRVFKAVSCEGRLALHLILRWGCSKDSKLSFQQHLLEKMKMKQEDYELFFDASMREKMSTNPSGDKFDVTLLHACIRNICTKLAKSGSQHWTRKNPKRLEYFCTSIIRFRNKLVHDTSVKDDTEMNEKLNIFQDLLINTIKVGGKHYNQSQSVINQAVTEMRTNISRIREARLAPQDHQKYQQQIRQLRKKQKNLVSQDGTVELAANYKTVSKVDPASFISGKERLQIKKVFTQLELVRKEKEQMGDGETESNDVSYEEILELKSEDGSTPTVILLEGEAGSGKTTMSKLMLIDWADFKRTGCSTTFQGIDRYDLVLYTQARNKSVSDFTSLLQALLPQVSNYLTDNDLVRSVRNLNVLLIFDGMDELNSASEQLIKEVFDKQIPASNGKLHVLLTTRPNKVPDLPNLYQNLGEVHIRLKGIAKERRIEYVSNLHNEMKREHQSQQSTEKLTDFIKQSEPRQGEHYSLPLNLTLVTYLWASDPNYVNSVTTTTGLYLALQKPCKSRLRVRLQESGGAVSFPQPNLEIDFEDFLQVLYDVCLRTLVDSSNSLQLSDESTRKLEKKCQDLNLSSDDMCAAFLAVESHWTADGYKVELSLPHKSIMEFYAASGLMQYLINSKTPGHLSQGIQEMFHGSGGAISKATQDKILDLINKEMQKPVTLENMMKNLIGSNVKFSNYKNVLLHLSGLLAHRQTASLLPQYAEQLVGLLKLAGVTGTQWLDLVVETLCNDRMAELVSHQLNNQITVKDGHAGAALKLFKYLPSSYPVKILLEDEVTYIPQLDQLLKELASRECDVELHLKHQWKHSQYGTSDAFLGCLTEISGDERCSVSFFTGYLQSLTVLPNTVIKLRISIVDNEHAKFICSQWATLSTTLNLEHLAVHVMAGVSPQCLKPLPLVTPKNQEYGSILLSDAKDIKWICQVARALLPKDGQYKNMMLPRCDLSEGECREMVKQLHQAGVKVNEKGSISFMSTTINKQKEILLRALTRQLLGCGLYRCGRESSVWRDKMSSIW